MELLLGVVGVVLVGTATIDALWTTLWTDGGGGPLTTVLSRNCWQGLLWVPERFHGPVLRVAGPALVLVAFGTWVALLVGGWWLLFLAGHTAIVDASTLVPAGAVDRLYYVGFSLFTLGVGDLVPQGGFWQIATVVMSATGLVIVTLGITYLIQIVSAVVDKRAFASSVFALGDLPHEVVVAAWDGRGFPILSERLLGLADQLGRLTEQHLAYPVLHYVHTSDTTKASALAVVVLDEAVTLLDIGVAPGRGPAPAAVRSARRTVGSFLEVMAVAFPGDQAPVPPPPDLAAVRVAGVPTVDDDAFAAALRKVEARRRHLHGLLRKDARTWPGTG